MLFSRGLFHRTIALLFTILLIEVLGRIPEFMLRWGDQQGKQAFLLVIQGAYLHGILFLRFFTAGEVVRECQDGVALLGCKSVV